MQNSGALWLPPDARSMFLADWFPGWSQHNHVNRQPNDDGYSEQDCVELRRVYHLPPNNQRLTHSFMWNDRDCTTPNMFLCERLRKGGQWRQTDAVEVKTGRRLPACEHSKDFSFQFREQSHFGLLVMTPRSLARAYQLFQNNCCLHLQGIWRQHVPLQSDIHLSVCTAP
jgi:hypothetical protein